MLVYVAVYFDPYNERYEVGGVYYNKADAISKCKWYNTVYHYDKTYIKLFSIL